MNLRTFSAPTFAQAITLVKSEMGGEAVILHTRTLQRRRWLGLRRREIVEITAGVGLNVTARPVRKPAQGKQGSSVAAGGTGANQAARLRTERDNNSTRPAAGNPANPGKDLLDTPA